MIYEYPTVVPFIVLTVISVVLSLGLALAVWYGGILESH